MKNADVVQAFVSGDGDGVGSHLFIFGKAIYSYGKHFPVALRLNDCYIFNTDKYSKTTAKHKTAVYTVIEKLNIPILSGDTKSLLAAIESGCKTKADYLLLVM